MSGDSCSKGADMQTQPATERIGSNAPEPPRTTLRLISGGVPDEGEVADRWTREGVDSAPEVTSPLPATAAGG